MTAKKVARRPINRAAAKGISYGPDEAVYDPNEDCLPSSGFVLTPERQRLLHERLRAEREAKQAEMDAAERIRLKKKEADRRAKEKWLLSRENRQNPR